MGAALVGAAVAARRWSARPFRRGGRRRGRGGGRAGVGARAWARVTWMPETIGSSTRSTEPEVQRGVLDGHVEVLASAPGHAAGSGEHVELRDLGGALAGDAEDALAACPSGGLGELHRDGVRPGTGDRDVVAVHAPSVRLEHAVRGRPGDGDAAGVMLGAAVEVLVAGPRVTGGVRVGVRVAGVQAKREGRGGRGRDGGGNEAGCARSGQGEGRGGETLAGGGTPGLAVERAAPRSGRGSSGFGADELDAKAGCRVLLRALS